MQFFPNHCHLKILPAQFCVHADQMGKDHSMWPEEFQKFKFAHDYIEESSSKLELINNTQLLYITVIFLFSSQLFWTTSHFCQIENFPMAFEVSKR